MRNGLVVSRSTAIQQALLRLNIERRPHAPPILKRRCNFPAQPPPEGQLLNGGHLALRRLIEAVPEAFHAEVAIRWCSVELWQARTPKNAKGQPLLIPRALWTGAPGTHDARVLGTASETLSCLETVAAVAVEIRWAFWLPTGTKPA